MTYHLVNHPGGTDIHKDGKPVPFSEVLEMLNAQPVYLEDYAAGFDKQSDAAKSIDVRQQTLSNRILNKPRTGAVWKGEYWIRYNTQGLKYPKGPRKNKETNHGN